MKMKNLNKPAVLIPVIIVVIGIIVLAILYGIGIFDTGLPKDAQISTEPPVTEAPPATQGHEHEYNFTVVNPSCELEGYTLYTCECGDVYKDEYTDSIGHDYKTTVFEPTTEAGGYTLYSCPKCGDEYKDDFTDPIVEETVPETTAPKNTGSTGGGGTSTPKPTEPKPTEPAPKPTEPAPTESPVTEPAPTEPKPTEPEVSGPVSGDSSIGEDVDLTDPNHPDHDYGYCAKCGRHFWTYLDQTGCFTFLSDTVCECGVLVKAGQCHHH